MRTKTKRIVLDALLAAIALTLFLVELQIPSVVPIPGVKLGLANVITVAALWLLTPADALAILFVRILLGAVFGGNMMALLYSAVGGSLCFLAMFFLRKAVTARQIWALSAVGAIAHNVGQMAVALAVTQTTGILVYLPVLLIFGTAAGIFTGLAAQFLIWRAKPLLPHLAGGRDLNNERANNMAKPIIENYVPIEDFYLGKQSPAGDLFRERFAVLKFDRVFRVVASRGEGLSAGSVLPIDPNEDLDFLRRAIAEKRRVMIPTAVGAAILFGEAAVDELIPALFPAEHFAELAAACDLLGREGLTASPAFAHAARTEPRSRATFDVCRQLSETLKRCSRLFCAGAISDFRLHCAEVAAFAGCRVNVGELPTGDFPICEADRRKWTLFLLCLFLSLRGASAEGAKFRMQQTERQTITTGMDYRANRDSRKGDAERFAFLEHPAFEGVELERTEAGYRLAVTLKRRDPSGALRAVSISERVTFALVATA